MLNHNTERAQLILPEYGRNIQQMVDYCLTVEDRSERNRCARTIIETMKTLLPQTGDQEEINRKLWDHLAIMSGFQLDIDYPYEVIAPDNLYSAPKPLEMYPNLIRYRHYGKGIEKLIDAACKLTDEEERRQLTLLIANQMKKLKTAVNPDGVRDESVINDLMEMSHGQLKLDPATTTLHEFTIADAPATSKKKRKKHKK